MSPAPIPDNEEKRLKALLEYQVLDTSPEQAYDDLCTIAAEICQTPIALVSLVDRERQWFKARIGLDAQETHRDLAFCAHAILQPDIFIIEDAQKDKRFKDNPLVTGDPYIRFYAGAPLKTKDGISLGTLCVIDRAPKNLSESQKFALDALSRQVMNQLELRLQTMKLERIRAYRDQLLSLISHDLRSNFNITIGYARALIKRFKTMSEQDIIDTAERIRESGEQANNTLNNMLEWAKAQLNATEDQQSTIRVADACNEAIKILRHVATDKGIEVQLHCATNIKLYTNAALLKSTLQNLLSNAIKFSYKDSIIDLEVKDLGHEVSIEVRDYGKGLTKEQSEKLFGDISFTTTGTEGEKGTGIGTLLIKDYVESANGHIHADCEEGKGCRITLKLPTKSTA